MDARELKEESEPERVEPTDPVTASMAQASLDALRGDFRSARQTLSRTRARVPPSDQTRLDALDSSFRVDPAVLVVIGLTAIALLVIGLSTLFH